MKNFEEIEKLYHLKEKGVITEQEFKNKKQELLSDKQEVKTSKFIKVLPFILGLCIVITCLYWYYQPIYNWVGYKFQTRNLYKIAQIEGVTKIDIDEINRQVVGVYNGGKVDKICKEICLILSDAKLFNYYIYLKNSSELASGDYECNCNE